MPTIDPTPAERTRWVALLVSRSRQRTLLCPFFAKCDGLLLIDPLSPVREFRPNRERTSEAICELILGSGATKLVCGFIGTAERERLAASGIDIRVGSCARSVASLVREFNALPSASSLRGDDAPLGSDAPSRGASGLRYAPANTAMRPRRPRRTDRH
ncbi:hypothetical protein ABMA32_23120 [Mesorhizobium sp. VNQ89]|uniref:hypothetical protein n=1 Tax=Mesorhizobium quangtriensis TaxID=3157709 RepID=UPI0032B794D9